MLIRLMTLLITLTLAACGSSGLPLENFPPISKTEGDAPFALTAPTSKSTGDFTYASSDPAVATIAGNVVTVVGAGTARITATQAEKGSFKSSTISAVLTVNPIQCTAPAIRFQGSCIAPPLTGNFITLSGSSWMPVSFIGTWPQANAFCTSTAINQLKGWRLPTEFELTALFESGATLNQGWSLSRTWSSTAGASVAATTPPTTPGTRKTVRLDVGVRSDELETNSAYIACVR